MIPDHRERFKEFCFYEKKTGGPDPHMAAVVHMCGGLPLKEQLWRTALYVGVYNVPSAEAIWRVQNSDAFTHDADCLADWFEEHWRAGGIETRRERRTCNTPTKMMDYLKGYEWTVKNIEWLQQQSDFEMVWKFTKALPRVGRYAATKLTEMWHRLGITHTPHMDIRAKGGWSPRTALQLIYPEEVMLLSPYVDTPDFVDATEELAHNLKEEMARKDGIDMSYFEFEVMLCEYKASYQTKRQYPGRSLDSELMYERRIAEYWKKSDTEHMHVRPLLSPVWALGEIQGWDGPRSQCANVLYDHDYTWSDSLYDFNKTTNFARPVRREQPL